MLENLSCDVNCKTDSFLCLFLREKMKDRVFYDLLYLFDHLILLLLGYINRWRITLGMRNNIT